MRVMFEIQSKGEKKNVIIKGKKYTTSTEQGRALAGVREEDGRGREEQRWRELEKRETEKGESKKSVWKNKEDKEG